MNDKSLGVLDTIIILCAEYSFSCILKPLLYLYAIFIYIRNVHYI